MFFDDVDVEDSFESYDEFVWEDDGMDYEGYTEVASYFTYDDPEF